MQSINNLIKNAHAAISIPGNLLSLWTKYSGGSDIEAISFYFHTEYGSEE